MNKKAFTINEMVLVITCILVLALAAIPRFMNLWHRVTGRAEQVTMDAFAVAVQLYHARYNAWPDEGVWPPDISPSTPGPFSILNSPPATAYPGEIGYNNGRTWTWYYNDPPFKILFRCPHYNASLPERVGILWAYYVEKTCCTSNCSNGAVPDSACATGRAYMPGTVIRTNSITHCCW